MRSNASWSITPSWNHTPLRSDGDDARTSQQWRRQAVSRALQRGLAILRQVDRKGGQRVVGELGTVAPELAHQVVAWAFGDIYSRPDLQPRGRQLVTLGMLTALGGCEPQLRVHINASLNVVLSSQEIVEALLHASVYCGFPRALNATFVARDVFAERGLLPVWT